MTTVKLTPEQIGQVGQIGVYRIDLSQSGLSTIASITIHDDNVISGWSGGHSGFDLDFVKLSSTNTLDPGVAAALAGDAVFDFSGAGVVFQPGFLRPLAPGDDPAWNRNLLGTTGANVYSPEASTLDVAAGRTGDIGALSLGEGGQVTFLLKSAVTAAGKYLYYGDYGEVDGSYVLVTEQAGTVPTDPGTVGPGTGVPGTVTPQPTQFTLYGTAGSDTIVLGVGVNAHLASTNNTVFGLGGHDRITGALGEDRLYGGRGNDRLKGGPGDDWLFGQAGNDLLSGGPGRDWLSGGAGRDKLSGGTGPDGFVFDAKLSARFNVDVIFGFNPKEDLIYLDNAVFKKAGRGSFAEPLQIKKAAFWIGDEAHDASDRILYDKSTGVLSYDPDGTGSAGEVAFAQLAKNLKLSYHDIFVF